jgi:hypothetical protein
MKIDYFNYWKLKLDCSNPLLIANNTALATYWTPGTPAIKSDITFGDGSAAIFLGTGNYYIFRAVNTITINGDFTVQAGAEFTAMPTPCY